MSKKNVTSQSRRKFFKAAAVTGAAAVATVAMPNVGAWSAAHAKTVTLKMQTAWPSGNDPFFIMAQDYATSISAMSGGSLKIELLPVGAILKITEIADGVSTGVVDAGHSVSAYWYGKNPASSLFGTGPSYGFSSQELMGYIEYGGGRALYEKLLKATGLNVTGYFAMPMPAQPFGWFKKHVKTVADVKGMKYRTVGLATNVLQAMGMVVRQLPGGEIQPGMKTGLIDAAEFNNPSSDRNFGMQDVSKHYHLGSFHQSQEMFEITFNTVKLKSLSPEHQAIIKYAAQAANTDNYYKALVMYSNDLGKLMNESGVNVYQTSDAILDAQLAAWDVVLKDFRKDALFDEIVVSQQKYAKKVMKYLLMNQPNYRLAYTRAFGEPEKVKI
jgi:TRAP-type mannitol/chloroaromatic compound transport system substrate-binding protein